MTTFEILSLIIGGFTAFATYRMFLKSSNDKNNKPLSTSQKVRVRIKHIFLLDSFSLEPIYDDPSSQIVKIIIANNDGLQHSIEKIMWGATKNKFLQRNWSENLPDVRNNAQSLIPNEGIIFEKKIQDVSIPIPNFSNFSNLFKCHIINNLYIVVELITGEIYKEPLPYSLKISLLYYHIDSKFNWFYKWRLLKMIKNKYGKMNNNS